MQSESDYERYCKARLVEYSIPYSEVYIIETGELRQIEHNHDYRWPYSLKVPIDLLDHREVRMLHK